MLEALVLGFGLSFIGSIPMTGPLALLVVDRIISAQRAAAFWIAVAGALVEAVVAAAVATFLPLLLPRSESLIWFARSSGALVIFGVGVVLMVRPELLSAIKTERKEHSMLAGFLATALNPTLLATWTVIVTSLHSSGFLSAGYLSGLSFGLGVGAGALGWFLMVIVLSSRFRLQQLTAHRLELGRAVGVLLMLVGGALLIQSSPS
jgi:threonine/homoserine/homoserine lactone efflux protein